MKISGAYLGDHAVLKNIYGSNIRYSFLLIEVFCIIPAPIMDILQSRLTPNWCLFGGACQNYQRVTQHVAKAHAVKNITQEYNCIKKYFPHFYKSFRVIHGINIHLQLAEILHGERAWQVTCMEKWPDN